MAGKEFDPAIVDFAKTMQRKLDENKDKQCDKMNPDRKGRSWKSCDLYWLLYRLRQETLELEEALNNTDKIGVINEAGDIGNFAMFIHDNVKKGN